MAEEKKITISRTLNGKIIYFIARNSTGRIIARELTQEKLEKAIKTYKEPPPVEEEKDEGKGVSVRQAQDESVKGEEATAGETKKEPEKKFLTNKLAEKVQERKKEQEEQESKTPETATTAKKKSFWDKLK